MKIHHPHLRCQRWREGAASERSSAEPVHVTSYGVEPISGDAEARAFIEIHHYSASYPAARFRVGLYRAAPFTAPQLVGVAVFSEPAQIRSIPSWLDVGRAEGVELGRFVLLDDVEGNGESWFLARAFKLLRAAKPEITRVLSYSDPVERCDDAGRLVKPGHYGTIYQASNARFMGRSSRKRELLDAKGRVFPMRALSKIRNEERGGGSAQRRLIEAGAPERRPHERARAYVERALSEGGFTSAIHPGKLVYAFGLDRAAKRALAANPDLYPKASQ